MTITGSGDVTLRGEYYGYGNPETAKAAASVVTEEVNANKAAYSSAMIINGIADSGKASIRMNGLKTLMLAGNAYIGSGNAMMGESLAVKSSQTAYLAPADCFLIKTTNPTTVAEDFMAKSDFAATPEKYINYEVTNDAFVDQYVVPLNIRATGYVKEVRFKEHQYVHRGDTLLVLDNREYQIKVKEAEAALLDARGAQEVLHSGIQTSQTNVAVQEANIAEAKAKLWQYEQDYHRFERLLKEESVPEQQYEQAKAAYEAAQARYDALIGQKKATLSQYSETSKRTTSAQAAILRKEADVDLAKLNLSYTVLVAPYDGYMGRRTLDVGQLVQAGQVISYLVRSEDKWITANYKETQISNIYIGQEVRIKVDALPGRVFKGRVSAISEATGSKYSLVPTDNSAGNFVKVQQRIPVRIDLEDVQLEDMQKLRAGMMVETEALRR